MGWGSGAGLLQDIVNNNNLKALPYPQRIRFFQDLIDYFQSEDCDTIDEVESDDMAWEYAYEEWRDGFE